MPQPSVPASSPAADPARSVTLARAGDGDPAVHATTVTEVPEFYLSERGLTYNTTGAGLVLFLAVLLPVVVALTRLLWRHGTAAGAVSRSATPSAPREDSERLRRLEHAVEAVAEEVERVAEGQRYLTRLLGEPAHAGPLLGADETAHVPVESTRR